LIAILISLVLLIPASQAAAQSGDICFVVTFGGSLPSGCYEWDSYTLTLSATVTDEGDCAGTHGTVSGGNLNGTPISCGGAGLNQNIAFLNITLPIGCDVVSWNAPYILGSPTAARTSVYNWIGTTWDKSHNSPLNTTGTFDWEPPTWNEVSGATNLGFAAANGSVGGTPGSAAFDYVEFLCAEGSTEPPGGIGDGLVQPIKEADQVDVFHGLAESGLIISDSSILATDASNIIPDAAKAPYVYSSISGTVTEVIPYLDGTFFVTVVGMVDGEEHEVSYGNLTDLNVLTGDEITQGCVIGKAGPRIRYYNTQEVLFEITYSIVNLDVPSTIPGLANYQNWTLYADPTGNTPCGDNFSGTCLNQNPAFDRDGQYWYGIENDAGLEPDFVEGGVLLDAGTAIAQDIEIADLSTYNVTIGAVATTNLAVAVTVTLGDDTDADNTFVDGAMQVIQTTTLTPTTPDTPPDLYTLTIEANRPLRLVYVCLADIEDATATPPSYCLLEDYSLETGDGWTFTDGAEIVETPGFFGIGAGTELQIPELGDAEQTIALDGYDDRDAVYDVVVKASVPWSVSTADYGELWVSYGATDPDYNQFSSFDVKQDLLTPTFRAEWTIPQGVSTTGDFNLNVPSLYGTTSYISVFEVCISPRDGYWPSQPNIPISESDALCSQTVEFAVENPTDIAGVGKWIVSALRWVGRFLDISIECNIARLKETMLRLLDPVIAWFGMIGRWLGYTIVRFANWLAGIVGYLVALLRNVFNSIVNSIWAALIGTAFFQGAFDNLDLVSTVIDTLIDLVMQIVGFIGRIVNVLATLAQIIAVFWTSVVEAFNDPTITETGMPACDAILESDPGYLMCIGLDLFDYVILAFPSLNVLGLVGIGAIALFTLKKLSERIGDAFGEVA
jgi:hypothetical protein